MEETITIMWDIYLNWLIIKESLSIMLVKIIVGACNKTWMNVITKINSSKGQRDISILNVGRI